MTSSASTPGELGQRDQPIGRDLAAGPGDTFVPGFSLLDSDLGFPLGSQADLQAGAPIGGF